MPPLPILITCMHKMMKLCDKNVTSISLVQITMMLYLVATFKTNKFQLYWLWCCIVLFPQEVVFFSSGGNMWCNTQGNVLLSLSQSMWKWCGLDYNLCLWHFIHISCWLSDFTEPKPELSVFICKIWMLFIYFLFFIFCLCHDYNTTNSQSCKIKLLNVL